MAADVFERCLAREWLSERDDVCGPILRNKADDVSIVDAMRVDVEILGHEFAVDLLGGLVVEQQRAKDRLFRLDRVRGSAQGFISFLTGVR